MDRTELEGLDRESLVVRAQEVGVRRARVLTRPELIDEILRRDPSSDEGTSRRARGFFGRARDLLSRVVERGLHLPDAADRLRTLVTLPPPAPRAEPTAVPTVTLAEIYAAQGHTARAVETLRLVLEREPEHPGARAMLAQLEDAGYVGPAPKLPPEAEIEPDVVDPPQAAEPSEAPEAADPPTDKPDPPTQKPDPPTAEPEPLRMPSDAAPTLVPGPPPRMAIGNPICVAIPIARGRAMHVSWTLGRMFDPEESGRFVVRLAIVTPSSEGPSVEMRDEFPDPAASEIRVHDLPERAVVRAAVGFLRGTHFVPVAHSPLFEVSRGTLTQWTLEGMKPLDVADPTSAFVARAFQTSRRAA